MVLYYLKTHMHCLWCHTLRNCSEVLISAAERTGCSEHRSDLDPASAPCRAASYSRSTV